MMESQRMGKQCVTMRKGETGDWRNHLTEEQLQRIIHWEKENLEGSDLEFVYDI